MRKSTFIALLALATALIGVAITVALYFAKKREEEFEEFADEFLDDDFDYFATHLDDLDEEEEAIANLNMDTEDTHSCEN